MVLPYALIQLAALVPYLCQVSIIPAHFRFQLRFLCLQLLQDICHDEHMTVLIITHNSALAPMAHKIIRFRSGKVISQEINEHPTPISDIEW